MSRQILATINRERTDNLSPLLLLNPLIASFVSAYNIYVKSYSNVAM